MGPSPEAGARLSLTFPKSPEPLRSGPIFPSASPVHFRFIIVIVITLPCHSSGPLPLQLPVTWHVLAPLLLQSEVSSKASGPQSSLPSSGLLYPPFHGFP